MEKLRNPILIVIALAVGALLYAAFTQTTAAPQVTFISLKGEKLSTGDLRGKVMLVNFWATDCAICVREMPELVRMYDQYRGRGFELIAVAMRHDPPNYVLAYAEKNRLPFKVALDPMGEHAKAFGDVRLTPTTFVIDKRGNIVSRIQGAPDFARLHELLDGKLAEPA